MTTNSDPINKSLSALSNNNRLWYSNEVSDPKRRSPVKNTELGHNHLGYFEVIVLEEVAGETNRIAFT